MPARHDVKDLGVAAVKLPDGQELELPLLQVNLQHIYVQLSLCRSVYRKLRECFVHRTQRETDSWTFESCNQRECSNPSVTQTHNVQAAALLPHVSVLSV